MNHVIEVTVSPRGETSIETKGYAGEKCLEATKFLEQSLGIVASDKKTGEFFVSNAAQQRISE